MFVTVQTLFESVRIQLQGLCVLHKIFFRQARDVGEQCVVHRPVLALVTGAVEMMIVDVQCIMQSLPEVASCFHTEVVTTNERAKVPGAVHVPFDEHSALDSGKALVKRAIDSFPKRNKEKIRLPSTQGKVDLIAGFSHETINYLLGGIFRASYRPLNDNIINGKIRGIAGVVGCNNPKVNHDDNHLTLVRELIRELPRV